MMDNLTPKKIVICEDHTIVYEGLRLLLEQSSNYQIIGHAENGKDLISLLRKQQPDILILDLNLPDADGFTLLKEARKIHPLIRVVILTMYHDELLINKAKEEGANAYLLKNTDNEELLKALDSDNPEEFYLTREVQKEMVKKKMFKDRFAQKMKITPREIEIIQRLARGFSTQQISEELFLSQHTVDTHRKNIFRKLEINSTADLVRFAHENKLI